MNKVVGCIKPTIFWIYNGELINGYGIVPSLSKTKGCPETMPFQMEKVQLKHVKTQQQSVQQSPLRRFWRAPVTQGVPVILRARSMRCRKRPVMNKKNKQMVVTTPIRKKLKHIPEQIGSSAANIDEDLLSPHTLTKNNNNVGIYSWFMSTLTKNLCTYLIHKS